VVLAEGGALDAGAGCCARATKELVPMSSVEIVDAIPARTRRCTAGSGFFEGAKGFMARYS
jgi:hypothetical protein